VSDEELKEETKGWGDDSYGRCGMRHSNQESFGGIYAPSYSNVSWENVDLCEYLASHGYVVVAGPDMGKRRAHDIRLIGNQRAGRDISFLIGYARSLRTRNVRSRSGRIQLGRNLNLFAASAIAASTHCLRSTLMRYFPGLVKQANIHAED